MRKLFCLLGLLSVSFVGCGQNEVKPDATAGTKSTQAADKGMADMATNPNVPAAMKERMKKMGPPGGAPSGTSAPGGAPKAP